MAKINIDKFICRIYEELKRISDSRHPENCEDARLSIVRKAIEEQGLRITDDFQLEEIKGNFGELRGISPKFKVGDWVVWNCLICEIKDISKDGYHCHNAFIPFAQEGDIIPCDDIEAKEIIRSNKIINDKILEEIDPHFLKIEPEKGSPNTQPLSLD